MNLDTFSSNIHQFSKLRCDVDEFYKTAAEIQDDVKIWQSLVTHIAQVSKTLDDLESERKSHAEELRQINQDINILEDMSKSMRSEVESRKKRVMKTIDEIDGIRNDVNQQFLLINLHFKEEATEEEKKFRVQNESISTTSIFSMSFPSTNSNFPIPSFLTSSTNPFSILNTLFPSSATSLQPPQSTPSSNLVNRHRMPPQFVEASKMKQCEHCGGNIHRNAPTCPMCKMKTKSKNPKKKKKNLSNQFLSSF